MQNVANASGGFWENFWLLVVTAVLTGLIVPAVKLFLDYMKEGRQKKFDSDLARQSKVVEHQIKLSEELTRLVWEYQFLCLKVSYYKALSDDPEKYAAACAEFDAKSWELLSRIRVEISKAKRLTSEATYERLNDFYLWLNGVDTELSALSQAKPGGDDHEKQWVAFHKTLFYEGGAEIDKVLALASADMGLASGDAADSTEAERRPERFPKLTRRWLLENEGGTGSGK
ncbi:MAG: hypothetical protein ABW250_07710 [Pyrinomonadaceae bacterium]